MNGHQFEEESSIAISAFYNVYNKLGYGFLEKVYEHALYLELLKYSVACKRQFPIKVFYEGNEVGNYFADLVINETLIIEIKAAEGICDEHEAQLLNYLKATDIEVGLLFNFGKRAEFKRKIFENRFK
jgi:GxxExxY protein